MHIVPSLHPMFSQKGLIVRTMTSWSSTRTVTLKALFCGMLSGMLVYRAALYPISQARSCGSVGGKLLDIGKALGASSNNQGVELRSSSCSAEVIGDVVRLRSCQVPTYCLPVGCFDYFPGWDECTSIPVLIPCTRGTLYPKLP